MVKETPRGSYSKTSLMTTKGVNMGDSKRKPIKYFVNDYSNLGRGKIFEIKRVQRKPSKVKQVPLMSRKRTRQSEHAPVSSKRYSSRPEEPSKRDAQKKAFKITKTGEKRDSRKSSTEQEVTVFKASKSSKGSLGKKTSVSTSSSPGSTVVQPIKSSSRYKGRPRNATTNAKKEKSRKKAKEELTNFLFKDTRKKRGPKKVKRAYKGDSPIMHFSLASDKL